MNRPKNARHGDNGDPAAAYPQPSRNKRAWPDFAGTMGKPSREVRRQKRGWKRGRR